MILKKEVLLVQNKWRDGIVKIGSLKNNFDVCKKYTELFLEDLYAFNFRNVLFKPTKAANNQFRINKESALSYFIGGNSELNEDIGFALNPWINVEFKNIDIILEQDRAIAMGNYYFTNLDNKKIKVEYTFGYKKYSNRLLIDLHHSSIPYRINN